MIYLTKCIILKNGGKNVNFLIASGNGSKSLPEFFPVFGRRERSLFAEKAGKSINT